MIKMTSKARYLLYAVLTVLFSCTFEEPTLPTWFAEWRLPIPDTRFVFSEEIVNDSTIIDTTDNGQNIVAISIEDSLERRNVSAADLAIKPDDDSLVQSVGDIRLEAPPTEASNPMTFEELFGISLTPGEQIDIPETEVEAATQFLVFQDFFRIINVKEGVLQIQFYNETFLNIREGMTISIFDSSSLEPLGDAVFSEAINANSVGVSDPVDLLGKTFTNVLGFNARIPIAGALDYTVTDEDTSSTIYFTATISEMKVAYADAMIPEQNFSEYDSVSVEDEEDKMITAKINNGHFIIDIDNRLPVSAQITVWLLNFYSDPNYTPESVFTKTYTLEAGSTDLEPVSLDGLYLTKYNNGPTPGSIITHMTYNVAVATIPSDDYVKIYDTDSVIVGVNVVDSVYVSQFKGIVAPVEVTFDPQEQETDIDSEGFDGSIRFDQLEMSLDIYNQIGFDLEVDLNIVAYKNNRMDSLKLIFNQNPFRVDGREPGEDVYKTSLILDQDNSNLVDFVEFLPEDIVSRGKAIVNKNEEVGEVTISDQVWGDYQIYTPFYLRISDNAKYTSEIDSADISKDVRESIEEGNLQSANISFTLSNGLPIGAQLIVYAATDSTKLFDDVIEDSSQKIVIDDIIFEAGEDLTGDGFVDQAYTGFIDIRLTEDQIKLFSNEVIYIATELFLDDTDGLVKFRQEDELNYPGAFKFQYRMNSE